MNIWTLPLLALSVFEVWMAFALVKHTVYGDLLLYRKRKIAAAIFIILLGSLMTYNRHIVFFSHTMLAVSVIATCVYICVLVRKQKFFVCEILTFYYVAVAWLDMVFAFFILGILKENFISEVYLNHVSAWSILIFVCSRCIVFAFILFIKKKNVGRELSQFQKMLFAVCISFVVVTYLFQIMLDKMVDGFSTITFTGGNVAFLMAFVLAAFLMATVLVVRYSTAKKQSEFLALQGELLKEHYQKLEEMAEENRQLLHDVKNHFLILQEMEREKDWEELHQYLSEAGALYLDVKKFRWTGNQMMDLVLSRKKAEAEQKGIVFELSGTSVRDLPMTDSEIVSLLGNLLDNAVEACERITDHAQRRIQVMVEQKGNLLRIQIENSVEEAPVVVRGKIATTKKNKSLHGYGLQNVKRVVNRYEGNMGMRIQENTFCVSITFFL